MVTSDSGGGNLNNTGSSVNSDMRPQAQVVNEFHTNDDTDRDANAHHHTLGASANQSAPGSHRHDGSDSILLLDGITLAGAKGGNTALASVISALVGLGAKDSTTA
jgi:hypothetical protein